ncbi:MAG: SpoIIE family protein phosphatase, partial [Bacteroidales bacterium]|nr:SpoIIE family protein phosphatase [Bacteroidales bacterium]
ERATKLYLYTDGAYEVKQPNGKMMKIDDLVNYLKKNQNVNATEIDNLYDYLIKVNEEETLEDDFTMMKINFR